jgi:peptide/nickel transport system permease protein
VSTTNFLGTDNFGRDLFSRLLHAVRVSYAIGFAAVGVEVVVGCLIGAVAAYRGGWLDSLMMRTADILFAFPPLLLAILLTGILGPSIPNIVLAIGISSWPAMARTVRAEVLILRQREFVEAARALGASDGRLILRHLLPNTLHIVAVRATLGIGVAIMAEATLSFLGLGIQSPMPSLGSMISEGYKYLRSQPYLLIEPAAVLSLLVVAFNFAGEGLADSLDPARRRPIGR